MAFTITQATNLLDKPILQALTSTGVSSPVHELGYTVRSTDGREYKYIEYDSSHASAVVAGAPCVIGGSEHANVIQGDVSDAGLTAVGIFLSILTDGTYGWIQTKGRAVDCPCTDGAGAAGTEVSAGDPLGATEDDLWTKVTIGGTTAEKAIARMTGDGGFATIELLS